MAHRIAVIAGDGIGLEVIPAGIDVLERAERQLKDRLKEALGRPLGGDGIRELASVQQRVGFLLKYKSYAVKAASPLGYSVFLQRPGEGFSFQRHREHKTEIFCILDVLPGGYIFFATSTSGTASTIASRFSRGRRGRPTHATSDFDSCRSLAT